jgi:mono/diheme cytochrome c family protein
MSTRHWVLGGLLVGAVAALTWHAALPVQAADAAPTSVSFEKDIAPLLAARCLQCHGAEKQAGNLDLRSRAAMLTGGDSGPALVAGVADKSLLYDMVRRGEMPPKKKGERLTAEQLALLRSWIDAGAVGPAATAVVAGDLVTDKDRAFWAFQKPVRPAVPTINNTDRARTPVDPFLLNRLEAKGLTFAPEADRVTLLRRATLDLTGLPPTPEELAAFLADERSDAYERLLDRLLANPHFGERWGRHWLDAAGYVDVQGGDNDAGTIKLAEGKWRYRDYVVRAYNQDKPFDRFLTEQLAGDELMGWRTASVLTPEMQELLIATTFLRSAADDTDENELNTLDIRHGILQRTGEVLASCLLALTVNCAKCHDHKYDPIPQRDYYRLMAILSPAFNPQAWLQPKQRRLPDVSPAEKAAIEKHNADIDRQIAELQQRQAQVLRPAEEFLFETRLTQLPETERTEVRTALQTPADKRNAVQKALAGKHEPTLKVKPEETRATLGDGPREELAAADRQITVLHTQRRAWGTIQAVYDTGPATPTHLLRRGNFETPGPEIAPGFLSVLCASDAAALLPEAKPAGTSSGRRLALARWLTTPDTPASGLLLRVQVNRIWQQLFGRGLVLTSDNFGHSGTRPTHPELLDWLTTEFVRGGWRLKPFLKLLMTSSAYRQASACKENSAAEKLDPANDLLWKMRLRRLESEAVRDALLMVSDRLDPTLGGPPVTLEVRPSGEVVLKDHASPGKLRRSIYVLARRNYQLSLLNVFDQPVVATNCTCRTPAAVVSQSLTMLNDVFVLRQADAFAERIVRTAGADMEKRIDLAYRIALSRGPSAQEALLCGELLRRHVQRYRAEKLTEEQAQHNALAQVCHVLLNTSEFLYVP